MKIPITASSGVFPTNKDKKNIRQKDDKDKELK